jgi:hypothetical protein
MGASIAYSYLNEYKNVKSIMAIDQSPKMLMTELGNMVLKILQLKILSQK